MNVPGHLAFAALAALGVSRVRGGRPEPGRVPFPGLTAALVGAVTPDLIDKPILALGGSVFGRSIGHSLVFLALALLIHQVIRRVGPAAGAVRLGFWALGIGAHFVADFLDDAAAGALRGGVIVSSWSLWPWVTPDTWMVYNAVRPGLWPWATTPVEILVLGATAAVFLRAIRRTRPGSGFRKNA